MSRRSGQNGSIQQDGNWYVVRFWKDVMGQEQRQRVRERICPISGPGKLPASERERRAKEIIAASGADSVEHFEKVVRSNHGVTFREQAVTWLNQVKNRKRKPVAPSTAENWESHLERWINPNIGDMPLDTVNNLAMKQLVAKMVASGELGPKSITNYTQVVKMVVASAVNEQGEELYPRKWNHEFIDMPEVKKQDQKQPSYSGEVVTKILAKTKKEKYRTLFALLASSGLRLGEALGIDVRNVSPDGTTINICTKAWKGELHNRLKTENGKREVDLHSSIAAMLREFIGERKSGLVFGSRSGKPLGQSNVLRQTLHPILAELSQPKSGAHAFRRFRNTYLRNHTSAPPSLIKFWMGHAEQDMGDLYDKIKSDVEFRKEVAEKAGIGFKLPAKRALVGPNGPKRTEMPDVQLAATA